MRPHHHAVPHPHTPPDLPHSRPPTPPHPAQRPRTGAHTAPAGTPPPPAPARRRRALDRTADPASTPHLHAHPQTRTKSKTPHTHTHTHSPTPKPTTSSIATGTRRPSPPPPHSAYSPLSGSTLPSPLSPPASLSAALPTAREDCTYPSPPPTGSQPRRPIPLPRVHTAFSFAASPRDTIVAPSNRKRRAAGGGMPTPVSANATPGAGLPPAADASDPISRAPLSPPLTGPLGVLSLPDDARTSPPRTSPPRGPAPPPDLDSAASRDRDHDHDSGPASLPSPAPTQDHEHSPSDEDEDAEPFQLLTPLSPSWGEALASVPEDAEASPRALTRDPARQLPSHDAPSSFALSSLASAPGPGPGFGADHDHGLGPAFWGSAGTDGEPELQQQTRAQFEQQQELLQQPAVAVISGPEEQSQSQSARHMPTPHGPLFTATGDNERALVEMDGPLFPFATGPLRAHKDKDEDQGARGPGSAFHHDRDYEYEYERHLALDQASLLSSFASSSSPPAFVAPVLEQEPSSTPMFSPASPSSPSPFSRFASPPPAPLLPSSSTPASTAQPRTAATAFAHAPPSPAPSLDMHWLARPGPGFSGRNGLRPPSALVSKWSPDSDSPEREHAAAGEARLSPEAMPRTHGALLGAYAQGALFAEPEPMGGAGEGPEGLGGAWSARWGGVDVDMDMGMDVDGEETGGMDLDNDRPQHHEPEQQQQQWGWASANDSTGPPPGELLFAAHAGSTSSEWSLHAPFVPGASSPPSSPSRRGSIDLPDFPGDALASPSRRGLPDLPSVDLNLAPDARALASPARRGSVGLPDFGLPDFPQDAGASRRGSWDLPDLGLGASDDAPSFGLGSPKRQVSFELPEMQVHGFASPSRRVSLHLPGLEEDRDEEDGRGRVHDPALDFDLGLAPEVDDAHVHGHSPRLPALDLDLDLGSDVSLDRSVGSDSDSQDHSYDDDTLFISRSPGARLVALPGAEADRELLPEHGQDQSDAPLAAPAPSVSARPAPPARRSTRDRALKRLHADDPHPYAQPHMQMQGKWYAQQHRWQTPHPGPAPLIPSPAAAAATADEDSYFAPSAPASGGGALRLLDLEVDTLRRPADGGAGWGDGDGADALARACADDALLGELVPHLGAERVRLLLAGAAVAYPPPGEADAELARLWRVRRRALAAERRAREVEAQLGERVRAVEEVLLSGPSAAGALAEALVSPSSSASSVSDAPTLPSPGAELSAGSGVGDVEMGGARAESPGTSLRLELQSLIGLRAEAKRVRKREKERGREVGALLRLKICGASALGGVSGLGVDVSGEKDREREKGKGREKPGKDGTRDASQLAARMVFRRREAAANRPLRGRRKAEYVRSGLAVGSAREAGEMDVDEDEGGVMGMQAAAVDAGRAWMG